MKGISMKHVQMVEMFKSVLGILKEPVALKAWKETPEGIPRYQGNAFPGMCTQIAEVLADGTTFHTDQEHCFCTGGVVSAGIIPPVSEQEKREVIEVHLSISKGYKDVDTAMAYDCAMARSIPPVTVKNAAVQVGLLRAIDAPDVVLLFCTPRQADILSRAYCYIAGEPIQGFGGNGGCPFLIQYPYVTKKPSFSYGDVAWRKYVGLAEEELTMSFPYESLGLFVEELPALAEAYRRYGEPADE
jgi:uncharacterized protein (DUF169 family)